ncbi:DMT family transporter [Bosea caraganae]|uniref:DMT family transporter n=1 Tax=Bosea caraganae TaxID=2763117 RepID=A0A370L248_9HYPH|nr:DMT family transporter [Bosea caraganae]RDJ21040.1 DMT family transporter [Bosea caraganae]RDJ28539.1 DMT family transporter [Bosea caraganae]
MTSASPALPAGSRPVFDATLIFTISFTVIAWASSFPAIRAGLGSFGPLEMAALRFALAGVPAALFLVLTRAPLPAASDIWRFLVGGIVFIAGYAVLLNLGQTVVPAGAASFIINTNPIMTAALAMLILGERFSLISWLGTAVSFAGIGLIALGNGLSLDIGISVLLILGAAFCNAITTVVQKPLFARHKPLSVAAWNMAIGGLALSPLLPNAIAQAQVASTEALFSVLYLAIVSSLAAYGTWAITLSRLPAARASNFQYCVPPIATLIGFLWLGEVPSALGIVGGLMALAGVVIVNLKR